MLNLQNIFRSWKTTATGVLICVIAIAGALQQQGVTGGKIEGGTWVAVICAVGTALLGAISKDPNAK